jgi:ketosteroid isomerase-like protein
MTEKDLVFRYFKLLSNKDMENLLNLFAEDAVVYEPFSKSEGLRGRASIEPFLRVAMMATDALDQNIVIENEESNGKMRKITALVTFKRGDKVRGRFTFHVDNSMIKTLNIQFP